MKQTLNPIQSWAFIRVFFRQCREYIGRHKDGDNWGHAGVILVELTACRQSMSCLWLKGVWAVRAELFRSPRGWTL